MIPDEAVRFIRLQRSRYSDSKAPDPEVAKVRFAAHVAEDFAGMVAHLPAKVSRIIEIGCGVGALAVHLKRHFPDATLALLDGDGETAVGSYAPTSAPYNSRKVTEALLAANGVEVDRWYDIGTKDLLEADLIVSLASLGYHYPLSTYRLKGFCIIDLRRGLEKMRGTVIFKGPKYDRCAFQMPA